MSALQQMPLVSLLSKVIDTDCSVQLFLFQIAIKYTEHKLCPLNRLQVHKSVALSTSPLLCSHPYHGLSRLLQRCRFDLPWLGKDPLEEETVPHSSILAWEIPSAEEPHRQATIRGVTRVRHD